MHILIIDMKMMAIENVGFYVDSFALLKALYIVQCNGLIKNYLYVDG